MMRQVPVEPHKAFDGDKPDQRTELVPENRTAG